ncbi:MAG TPA: hypothetical protein VF614_04540 [Chthoniobacteraceae bacterium]
MKHLHRPLRLLAPTLLAIGGCIFAPPHAAQAADEPPSVMIEVQAHFVRTTHKGITAALTAAGGAQAPALLDAQQLEKALASLRSGGAQFISSPRGITTSGHRASVEAIREMRYPTEWNQSPKTPGVAVPVAFETRNVGVTFAFEPVAQAGNIDITMDARVVSFLGFLDYSQQPPLKPGNPAALDQLPQAPLKEGGTWQPIFVEEKNTTHLKLKSGASALISLGGLPPAISVFHQQQGIPADAEQMHTYLFIGCRTVGME